MFFWFFWSVVCCNVSSVEFVLWVVGLGVELFSIIVFGGVVGLVCGVK